MVALTLGDKIRALMARADRDHGYGYKTALKDAAALADEHQAEADALVGAAYEAAADACADYPRVAPDATEAQHYDEQIDHSQACIRALTDADARAALDRLIREAEAQGYLAGFNASGEGWNGEYPFADYGKNPEEDADWVERRNAILRAAAGEADNG